MGTCIRELHIFVNLSVYTYYFWQVSVKYPKGGKETKMDLMVMENLFYKRKISRVYDLKGSARSRYNPDTTGANKVMLDMNLIETLRTKPIFLGSRAKRSLERAVWNDTSFLAVRFILGFQSSLKTKSTLLLLLLSFFLSFILT